jgi:benzodiazapine receptor
MWMSIILCIFKFKSLSSLASGLMVPYLLWVTFATALNTAILVLN